jgi:glyoxylase-like metal-dependent hydrolase (beta-lactamase superfamily II)
VPHVPSKTRKKIEWLFGRAEGALLSDAVTTNEGAHLDPKGALENLLANKDQITQVGDDARFAELEIAIAHKKKDDIRAYVDRRGIAGVRAFTTNGGARIYLMRVETFPRHINNVYVILKDNTAWMLDCGSGLDSSRRDLALGFAVLRDVYGETTRYEDLDGCIISHAHIDHFGGANLLAEQSRAIICVHELDARVLECFDERLVIVQKDIDIFWRRAGVPESERVQMLELYGAQKRLFRPQAVGKNLRDGEIVGPDLRVHHVPGHCPGLICVGVDDVLLTSDHVLARTTPHQFPQAITPFAGLEHYFQSLEKIRRVQGVRLALGGHEEPMPDLRTRIDAIESFHRNRLDDVMRALFGSQDGYGELLAIEEAGAHVEYLHNLGKLRVANLDDVATARDPVIQYVARG